MPKRNLAWILVVALIALLFWKMPRTLAGRDALFSSFGPLLDVRAEILKRTAEPVDDDALCRAAARAGAEAMVRALNDPYALYLDRETYPEFRKQSEGVFGGIGVDARINADGLEIISRVRGGPAEKAGLLPRETILSIDDFRALDLGLVDGIGRLSGPAGTPVRLVVRDRDGVVRRLELLRATIEINPVRGWTRAAHGGWRYWLDEPRGIAAVRVIRFMPQTLRQLDAVIEPLVERGLRGLIIDLRENPGGLLLSAIDVADRFLDSGPIVSTRGPRTAPRQWFAQREDTYPAFRVVVLVNRNTASAAEIVSGALQDQRRAVVLGERTYGKGSLQELIPLPDNESAIKITTGHYYLPSGRCLHRRADATGSPDWGVTPDIAIAQSDAERARWLDAWNLAGAEPPEETPTHPADAPTTARDDDALKATLAADPVLARGLELLQQPRPPATTPVARSAAP